DPILSTMRHMGFNNDAADNVHVIYVPCYLNGDDVIFDMTYYELLIGFDLTVFASYYEPWGYTPLESIAFGVPTVTTNLSGFGQWVLSDVADKFEDCGVKVIERTDHNYHHCVVEIQDFISRFAALDAKVVTKIAQQAKRTARMASWSNFIKYYLEAYGLNDIETK
ncbi:MAG: glycosyltransferase, partial [Muribaculaceae bacterium]|nr:glycosyltransferase [Muribaculaceae bacterium]